MVLLQATLFIFSTHLATNRVSDSARLTLSALSKQYSFIIARRNCIVVVNVCKSAFFNVFKRILFNICYNDGAIMYVRYCRKNCWLGNRRKNVGKIFPSGRKLWYWKKRRGDRKKWFVIVLECTEWSRKKWHRVYLIAIFRHWPLSQAISFWTFWWKPHNFLTHGCKITVL